MSPSEAQRPVSCAHDAHDFNDDLARFSAKTFRPHLEDGT